MNDEQGLGLKRKRVLQNVSPVSRELIKFCKSFLYSLKNVGLSPLLQVVEMHALNSR